MNYNLSKSYSSFYVFNVGKYLNCIQFGSLFFCKKHNDSILQSHTYKKPHYQSQGLDMQDMIQLGSLSFIKNQKTINSLLSRIDWYDIENDVDILIS